MMKEGTGGRKEEDGDRNDVEDGKKEYPKNGMTGINPAAAAYGREYCWF